MMSATLLAALRNEAWEECRFAHAAFIKTQETNPEGLSAAQERCRQAEQAYNALYPQHPLWDERLALAAKPVLSENDKARLGEINAILNRDKFSQLEEINRKIARGEFTTPRLRSG